LQKINPVEFGQLTFHPVALKVLPALPMVTVRSHIPGRLAVKKKKLFFFKSPQNCDITLFSLVKCYLLLFMVGDQTCIKNTIEVARK